MNRHTSQCLDCSSDFIGNNWRQVRCNDCRLFGAGAKTRNAARGVVAREIRAGRLANLKTQVVPCSDCGARATQYDHRDYSRPTMVEPVCHVCNRLRGSVSCAFAFQQDAA